MNAHFLLLADVLSEIHAWGVSKSGSIQMWSFVGLLVVISGGIFFWALNFRKPSRHRHHHRHHRRERPEPEQETDRDDEAKSGWFFSKRRHRRRKRRWRANPTLAETGGLPQPRDPRTPPTV